MGIYNKYKITILRDTHIMEVYADQVKPGDYIYSQYSISRVCFVYKSSTVKLMHKINDLIVTPNTLVPIHSEFGINVDNIVDTENNNTYYKLAKDINIGEYIVLYNKSLEEVQEKSYIQGSPVYILTTNDFLLVGNYSIPCYTHSLNQRYPMKVVKFLSEKSNILASQKLYYPFKKLYRLNHSYRK